MLWIEEDAKEKRCPQLSFDVKSALDYSISRKASKCIGSECMMWREETEVRVKQGVGRIYGWCGIAGTPLVALIGEE